MITKTEIEKRVEYAELEKYIDDRLMHGWDGTKPIYFAHNALGLSSRDAVAFLQKYRAEWTITWFKSLNGYYYWRFE